MTEKRGPFDNCTSFASTIVRGARCRRGFKSVTSHDSRCLDRCQPRKLAPRRDGVQGNCSSRNVSVRSMTYSYRLAGRTCPAVRNHMGHHENDRQPEFTHLRDVFGLAGHMPDRPMQPLDDGWTSLIGARVFDQVAEPQRSDWIHAGDAEADPRNAARSSSQRMGLK